MISFGGIIGGGSCVFEGPAAVAEEGSTSISESVDFSAACEAISSSDPDDDSMFVAGADFRFGGGFDLVGLLLGGRGGLKAGWPRLTGAFEAVGMLRSPPVGLHGRDSRDREVGLAGSQQV